jgi:hypothetical protein
MEKGKPLTANSLAKLLKPFGIFPEQHRREDGSQYRGYLATDFDDAFGRYVPGFTPSKCHKDHKTNDFDPIPNRHNDVECDTSKTGIKPAESAPSDTVTHRSRVERVLTTGQSLEAERSELDMESEL